VLLRTLVEIYIQETQYQFNRSTFKDLKLPCCQCKMVSIFQNIPHKVNITTFSTTEQKHPVQPFPIMLHPWICSLYTVQVTSIRPRTVQYRWSPNTETIAINEYDTTAQHVVILPTTHLVFIPQNTCCHAFLRVSPKFCETGLFTRPLPHCTKSTVWGMPNTPENGNKQLLEHCVY